MILNLAPRIIKNLLLPDIDEFLARSFKGSTMAISPVMEYDQDDNSLNPADIIEFHNDSASYYFIIYTNNFLQEEIKELKSFINSIIPSVHIILGMLFSRKVSLKSGDRSENSETLRLQLKKRDYYRIDIAISLDDDQKQISLIIPMNFLKLFSSKMIRGMDTEFLENEIINFFQYPLNYYPRFINIIESFDDLEIQNLLYLLQKKNLLSIYQMCLLITAFPNKALSFKHNLSTANIHEITSMMKTLSSPNIIGKRDIAEGIYSVEEAIFRLMKSGIDFSYSKFLAEMQKIIITASVIEVFHNKSFYEWFEEIHKSGLLNQTLAVTGEMDIAKAIFGDAEKFLPLLRKNLTSVRVKEIIVICRDLHISFMKRINAQYEFINNYRKIKIQKRKHSHEGLEYLLLTFERDDDYNRLLLDVGWFVLSTALKGMNKVIQQRILPKIYTPAQILIEDVLRGVVNPNILHDEIQIKKAEAICAERIFSLYEDGIIHLSL